MISLKVTSLNSFPTYAKELCILEDIDRKHVILESLC
jgi:hypothetical protein